MSDDNLDNRNETVLQRRIRERLAALNMKPRAASLAAEMGPTALRDILSGRVAHPRSDSIAKLAAVLGVDPSYLQGQSNATMSGKHLTTTAAPVIGNVQAGIWTEVHGFDVTEDMSELEHITCVADPDFPELDQVAFKVVGESINQVCPDGGFAVCLFWDSIGIEPAPGMFVVAERNRHGLYETTIKQIGGEPGAWKLLPRSTDPYFKPISLPSDSPDEEVRIIALVRRFVTPTLTW